MSENSVLHRKLNRAEGTEAAPDGALLRAMRLGLARAARQAFGLRIDVIGTTMKTGLPEDVAGDLPAGHLLILLEADENRHGKGGVSGALALGPDLARALVQQQTVGTLALTEPQDRPFTETDAALCAPLVDSLMSQAAALVDSAEDRASLHGHKFGARVLDAQAVSVALEAAPFHVITQTLDIAEGAAQSTLTLILPDCPTRAEDAAEGGSPRRLADVAMNVPVRLNAVMCRVSMMWGDLAALRPGDKLPLPGYRLDQTELLSMSGQPVGMGRLGKVDGLRAVRVNEPAGAETGFAEAVTPPKAPSAIAPLVTAEPSPNAVQHPIEDLPLEMDDQDEALRRISELAGLDGELVDAPPGG